MKISAHIIDELHIAEEAFKDALDARDYVAASRWHNIISDKRGELQVALDTEDPCTTLADVRHFERFTYV
jgi:predicted negative regulator of RcsB-dependent stress response